MGKQKSVRLNYLMNCILTASSMIFPLLSYPYVSRILQPDGMGKVAFANSIVSYFAMVAMLGIPTYGIRACAKVRDDKNQLSQLVWELLILNFATTLITCVLFGICIVLVPRFAQDKLLFVLMGSSMFFQMLGVEWLFRALEEYSYITIRSLIFKIIALCMMFLFIADGEDYIIYGVLTVAAIVGCVMMANREMAEALSPALIILVIEVVVAFIAYAVVEITVACRFDANGNRRKNKR